MHHSAKATRRLVSSVSRYNHGARSSSALATAPRPKRLSPSGLNSGAPPGPADHFVSPAKPSKKAPTTSVLKQYKEPLVVSTSQIIDLVDQAQDSPRLTGPFINEVGVQHLSPELHSQIFPNTNLPTCSEENVETSRQHLKTHGLDIKLASRLPTTSFDLPKLQGRNIDEHFYNIGIRMAQPWLSIAETLEKESVEFPPKPEHFELLSGWTRYSADGECRRVPDLGLEEAVCFDVETMPAESSFAAMACAVSREAWYVWISPWLLGESPSTKHLIPLGDPNIPRIIVGHNVSYDRARILEEYSLRSTKNRFLDTMSLHIAVRGISSGQRAAWTSHRKLKRKMYDQKLEAFQNIETQLQEQEQQSLEKRDQGRYDELIRCKAELEESLPELMAEASGYLSSDEAAAKRWEDVTATNSLAEVARLYCHVDVDKSVRDDFMSCSREEILKGINKYLGYCADDVLTTLDVYRHVLPAFLESCPNPVSFAGVLTMGSSFLTVDQEWDNYINSAESKYRELESAVRTRLVRLAEAALAMYENDANGRKPWETDEWLSQLDWTPKKIGKSRGAAVSRPVIETQPKWYRELHKPDIGSTVANRIVPFLLEMTWHDSTGNYYLFYSSKHGWLKGKPTAKRRSKPVVEIADDDELARFRDVIQFMPLTGPSPTKALLGRKQAGQWLEEGTIACKDRGEVVEEMALRFLTGTATDEHWEILKGIGQTILAEGEPTDYSRIAISQLDWTPISTARPIRDTSADRYWPQWYWELTAPKPDLKPGTLNITTRSQATPLLMRLSWLSHPLYRSRQHGWTYRISADQLETVATTYEALIFNDEADAKLRAMAESGHFSFYKLPHKDGEKANVGSPMSKMFLKYCQDGTLSGPGDDVKSALDMNAQCSYWISARDRAHGQMVVFDGEGGSKMDMPATPESDPPHRYGMILPQVITMGTVTRRAIEKTWLTASNAKENRVGSELKTLVRAPEGYALVGADVDSEELWIASVMGDSQFGMHGATAIGWMTLEGTKAAGTDLHSKTASILGISRNDAKIFNYSRIYGAGVNHAILLLLQHNASLKQADASKLAKELYASTKGKSTSVNGPFERKFWHGGTESYLFNKLEEIGLSDDPRTPALGCGITTALQKKHLPEDKGNDYMPSRINWVVQSSGVDYLHMLIVSINYLIEVYDIEARYLISIHDEVRYLAEEKDQYRLALALQVANLWTRCMFAYKLGFDNLPQGVAFFSAVDVDKYLRKEVDMTCVTPSQPNPLPPGESLTIDQILEKTERTLGTAKLDSLVAPEPEKPTREYVAPDPLAHREGSAEFLCAQATTSTAEVRRLGTLAKVKKQEEELEPLFAEAEADPPRKLPTPRRSLSNKTSAPKSDPPRSRWDQLRPEDRA